MVHTIATPCIDSGVQNRNTDANQNTADQDAANQEPAPVEGANVEPVPEHEQPATLDPPHTDCDETPQQVITRERG